MTTTAEELLKLAEKATPGPWKHVSACEIVQLIAHETVPEAPMDQYPGSADISVNAYDHYNRTSGGIQKTTDADYIAAANPATLTPLLHELILLRSAIKVHG